MKTKNTQRLAKFLTYVLGRRPDEFGLVPEADGYFNIKELLKSMNEEEGWRHVRMAHINEVALTVVPSPIELEGKRIRAKERSQLPKITPPEAPLPKLLYIAIRNRAYPAIAQKGVRTEGRSMLVLSSDEQMATRIGKRRDNHPVMLTVQVARSMGRGTSYQKFGETLYLTDTLFPDTFSGPPLPKEKPTKAGAQQQVVPTEAKTPGSYFPELTPADEPKRPRRKEVDWKKDRRLARKHKSRR